MKFKAILLLVLLTIVSCDNQESHITEARVGKPFYRDVKFYIREKPLVGATSGVMWESDRIGTSFSTGDLDEATNRIINEYSMRTAYAGSDSSKKIDFHTVTISPPDSNPIIIEVAFDGSPIEIWNDDRYAAGLERAKATKANKAVDSIPHTRDD